MPGYLRWTLGLALAVLLTVVPFGGLVVEFFERAARGKAVVAEQDAVLQ